MHIMPTPRFQRNNYLFMWQAEEIPPLFGPSLQYPQHFANGTEELERSFETNAHSEKSMNVSDVKVTDEDGYLSRSKTIKENSKIVKKPLGYTSEDAIDERIVSIEYRVCEPIQGVQDCTCECPRSQNLSRRRRTSPPCMTKWSVCVTHRTRRKHNKLTLGDLIPADCVGREILTRPRWLESLCWLPWERSTRLQREACDETVFVSRYTGHKPNNVWSDLKHLRAHEHGERSDPGLNYGLMSETDLLLVFVCCLTRPCCLTRLSMCCLAQDIEHPIPFSPVVSWKSSCTPDRLDTDLRVRCNRTSTREYCWKRYSLSASISDPTRKWYDVSR